MGDIHSSPCGCALHEATPALRAALENLYGDLYLFGLDEIKMDVIWEGSFAAARAVLISTQDTGGLPSTTVPEHSQASDPEVGSVHEAARRAAEKIFQIVKDKFDYSGTAQDCENTTASLAQIIITELSTLSESSVSKEYVRGLEDAANAADEKAKNWARCAGSPFFNSSHYKAKADGARQVYDAIRALISKHSADDQKQKFVHVEKNV